MLQPKGLIVIIEIIGMMDMTLILMPIMVGIVVLDGEDPFTIVILPIIFLQVFLVGIMVWVTLGVGRLDMGRIILGIIQVTMEDGIAHITMGAMVITVIIGALILTQDIMAVILMVLLLIIVLEVMALMKI